MIRIVGLSATLPNYKDVGRFLRVREGAGLFYFGPEFRPVPLEMEFVGVTASNMTARANAMNEICYNKVGGAAVGSGSGSGEGEVGLGAAFLTSAVVLLSSGQHHPHHFVDASANLANTPRPIAPQTHTQTTQHNAAGRRRAQARQAGHGLRAQPQGDGQDGPRAG